MADPTWIEMREHLNTATHYSADVGGFDIEEAIYWFANDYHGGQASNLYSVLSTSDYKPGPITNGPEPDSIAADLYSYLVDEFAG